MKNLHFQKNINDKAFNVFLRFISTTLLKFMFRNFYVKNQHYTVLYQNQVIYTATLQDTCLV